jgi:DinB superfamily
VTREDRQQKLESFGRAPALLSLALRQFPKKMWLYKPALERWSIHEIILHLADSEASAYVRCRWFIAEPGSSATEFDAARWAGSLGYYYQSTREALEIIRRLRKMTYQLLVTLPEGVWANRVANPVDGTSSLEDWVERQERHIPHHIEQMKQNYEIWLSTHPPRKPASTTPRPSAPSRMISLTAGI